MSKFKKRRVGLAITGGAINPELLNLLLGSAARAIEREGCQAVALSGGFGPLAKGNMKGIIEVPTSQWERWFTQKYSDLVTERHLPRRNGEEWERIITPLTQDLEIERLISIGGNGTGFTLAALHKHAKGRFARLIQCPKTMDGDLLEPDVCLGFHSALHHIIDEVRAFQHELSLYGAPYITKILGREAGHLCLHAAYNAGASISLIPEEIRGRKISAEELIKILAGSQIKKLAVTGGFGEILLAEGILDCIDREGQELLGARFSGMHKDRLDYASSPFEAALKESLAKLFADIGVDPLSIGLAISARSVGYVPRASKPVNRDRQLAVLYGERAGTLACQNGVLDVPLLITSKRDIPLTELYNEAGDDIVQCYVNVRNGIYSKTVRNQYRLLPRDLEGRMLEKLSSVTKLSAPAFREMFLPTAKLVESLPLL